MPSTSLRATEAAALGLSNGKYMRIPLARFSRWDAPLDPTTRSKAASSSMRCPPRRRTSAQEHSPSTAQATFSSRTMSRSGASAERSSSASRGNSALVSAMLATAAPHARHASAPSTASRWLATAASSSPTSRGIRPSVASASTMSSRRSTGTTRGARRHSPSATTGRSTLGRTPTTPPPKNGFDVTLTSAERRPRVHCLARSPRRDR